MKDGWWINYETGTAVAIHDHELDIRNPSVARQLGIPEVITSQFGKYIAGLDRVRLLKLIIENAPVMRVRGHGSYVTFEYSNPTDHLPRERIREWCTREGVGPLTALRIANFCTGVLLTRFAGKDI